MTDYAKPSVLPAWGESNTTSADMIQPSNSQIQAGWPLSGTPPSRQRFNWLLNFCANAVRYFMQRGIPDYDATENYRIGSKIIGDDGETYTSLVNANVGNTPSTSPLAWRRWGYTLDEINASQLTQALLPHGDDTSKVASSAFVQQEITAYHPAASQNANLANVSRFLYLTANPDSTPPASDIYQNNSSSPLLVHASADGGNGGFHARVYCDVSPTPTTPVAEFCRVNAGSNPPNYYPGGVTFLVPAGYYYGISATSGGGAPTLRLWTEWPIG